MVRDYRIIDCSACDKNHRLVIETNYMDAMFMLEPESFKQMSEKDSEAFFGKYDANYTLVYKCPVTDSRMQVDLSFPSEYGHRFIDAGVTGVQLNW